MIGAGVFTTSGFALADLGSARWVLLAWAVGGVVALAGAVSYGGLATRIPRSGGEYVFLSEALHPAAGFFAGWVSLLAGFTGPIAAAALAFESYAGALVGSEMPAGLLGSAVIALAALLHGRRVRLGAANLNLAVACKLVGLAAFIAFGAFAAPVPLAAHAAPPDAASVPLDWGAFAVTLIWISFSYSGWNGAVYLAEEIRDPERNLVRALWASTLGVALVYVALNAVFLSAAPASALVGRPDVGAVAAEHLGGAWLRRAMAGLVGLALFTSVSAMIAAGPRVYLQMTRDGFLPAWLLPEVERASSSPEGERSESDAPGALVALQALLAILVVWLTDLASLISTLGFVLALSSALAVAVACRLRLSEGPRAVPIPLFPLPPLIYIGATLWSAWFLIQREPGDVAVAAALLAAGLPLYWLARIARRRTQP